MERAVPLTSCRLVMMSLEPFALRGRPCGAGINVWKRGRAGHFGEPSRLSLLCGRGLTPNAALPSQCVIFRACAESLVGV
jgi:hypothetical protein